MRGGSHSDGHTQKQNALIPLFVRCIDGMRDADGGKDKAEEPPGGQDFRRRAAAEIDDMWRKTIKAEGEICASAKETARHPPQGSAKPDTKNDKRQPNGIFCPVLGAPVLP